MPKRIECQLDLPRGTPLRRSYCESTFRLRMDPVPGTGNPRSRRYAHCLRRPRTQRSRTWALAHRDQGLADIKAHHLPTAWDDLPRRWQRSWKKRRLTQCRMGADQRRAPGQGGKWKTLLAGQALPV